MKPHEIVVQRWGIWYRADLMIGTTICETGFGMNPKWAVDDLRRICQLSAWRDVVDGCAVRRI